MDLIPTREELDLWLLEVAKHSSHVEFYLAALNAGHEDPQRPHDAKGIGSKLDWDVAKHLALEYRNPSVDFETHILPGVKLHRKQFHHERYNFFTPNTTLDNLRVGAIDAICSLREPRTYQGGVRSWDSIAALAEQNPQPHIRKSMLMVLPEMMKITQPNLDAITSPDNIPNIGLLPSMYSELTNRIENASTDFDRRYARESEVAYQLQ